MNWSPDSWRAFEARQQPVYPDRAALDAALADLSRRPALVAPGDVDALVARLADAQRGEVVLLQAGDCAERLSDTPADTAAMAALIDALAREIGEESALPVVRVGRIAGQFAKPRSSALDRRDGGALPVWRGDSVNDMTFDASARRPDPSRLLAAYDHAEASSRMLGSALFTSHEALLLPFEQAMIRRDEAGGRWFAGSAHCLWIGARTLFPGSAHVELLRGLANPIGLKCGPELSPHDLIQLLDGLNPERQAGRITLIARMGADRIATALPPLMGAVRRSGHPVLWCCDPMHGNTMRASDGLKHREMARIEAETRAFAEIAVETGIVVGGLHLELTHRAVAECDGAGSRDDCRDPRLNPDQARRIALLFAAARTRSRAPALT
jgi:3-deoxy-7-phosphoheptulonate synthase